MVKRQVEDGDGVDIYQTQKKYNTVCFLTVTKTD